MIGPLFALEGLYGWKHLRPRMHLATGMIVALSGVASAIAVVIANAWMNTPIGFTVLDGVLCTLTRLPSWAILMQSVKAFPFHLVHTTVGL